MRLGARERLRYLLGVWSCAPSFTSVMLIHAHSSTRSYYDTHFTTEETETQRVQEHTRVRAEMLVKTSSVGLEMRWSTTLPSPISSPKINNVTNTHFSGYRHFHTYLFIRSYLRPCNRAKADKETSSDIFKKFAQGHRARKCRHDTQNLDMNFSISTS